MEIYSRMPLFGKTKMKVGTWTKRLTYDGHGDNDMDYIFTEAGTGKEYNVSKDFSKDKKQKTWEDYLNTHGFPPLPKMAPKTESEEDKAERAASAAKLADQIAEGKALSDKLNGIAERAYATIVTIIDAVEQEEAKVILKRMLHENTKPRSMFAGSRRRRTKRGTKRS